MLFSSLEGQVCPSRTKAATWLSNTVVNEILGDSGRSRHVDREVGDSTPRIHPLIGGFLEDTSTSDACN